MAPEQADARLRLSQPINPSKRPMLQPHVSAASLTPESRACTGLLATALTSLRSRSVAAIGAVAVAAVGVMGAFKMALWAASESGRSLSPGDAQPEAEDDTATEPSQVRGAT